MDDDQKNSLALIDRKKKFRATEGTELQPRGRRAVHGVRSSAAVQHPDVVDERREAIHGRRRRRRRHRRVVVVASNAGVDDEQPPARLQLR